MKFVFFSSSWYPAHTGSILVPPSTLPGDYRMRIICSDGRGKADLRDPCLTTLTDGEFEDYKVTVVDLNAACSGTPNPGIIVLSPNSGGLTTPVNGTAPGQTLAAGLAYQWQYSDNGSTWIDIPGQTSISLLTPAKNVVGTRQYRRKITCNNSGETATSTPATYTTTNIGDSMQYLATFLFIGFI